MARLLSVTARLGRRGAFFRDALGLCSVDAGHGWLIFALPRAEADFSPSASNGRHELSLLRDDVHAEIEGLREKGLTRSKGPAPHGAGIRGRRDGEGGEQERIREGIGLCESPLDWYRKARAETIPLRVGVTRTPNERALDAPASLSTRRSSWADCSDFAGETRPPPAPMSARDRGGGG